MPLFRASNHPLGQLRHELDRVFFDLTRNLPGGAVVNDDSTAFPPLNMWETEQELFLEAEVPGLNEADLEVFVVGNELTIKGNRGEARFADAAYHRRERSTGAFSRAVRLPIDVDASKVQATLRGGVLEITLPKAELAKPRKITVTTAK